MSIVVLGVASFRRRSQGGADGVGCGVGGVYSKVELPCNKVGVSCSLRGYSWTPVSKLGSEYI